MNSTDTMRRRRLLACTLSEVSEARSAQWAWTLAHFEEALVHIPWLRDASEHQTGEPVILHHHRHGSPCTDLCLLLDWPAATDRIKPGGFDVV